MNRFRFKDGVNRVHNETKSSNSLQTCNMLQYCTGSKRKERKEKTKI